MIKNKIDLIEFIEADRNSLGRKRKHPPLFGDEVWKFEIALRKFEYCVNTRSPFPTTLFWRYRYHHLSLKLGFDIPINVFDKGLCVRHWGCIVVNPLVRVGKNCIIQQGVNIGRNIHADDIPVIGNDVYIGPGAKLFGQIHIADGIAIGANAVVNKSFEQPYCTIAGVPAQVIGKRDSNLK